MVGLSDAGTSAVWIRQPRDLPLDEQGEIVDSGEPAALFRKPRHAYTREIAELLNPGV